MKELRRLGAVAKKELLNASRYRFSVITQFLITPTMSVLTAGLLYSGVFRRSSALTLGEMNAANYKALLLVGLLVHSFIGNAYYGLSSKIVRERAAGTLALLWIAPGSRLAAAAGLVGPEALRCLVLWMIGCGAVSLLGPLSLGALVVSLGCLGLVFALGVLLGFLRGALIVVHEGAADLLDQFYLVFIFTACLYLPKALLPSFLWPLCDMNPLFRLTALMKNAFGGHVAGNHAAAGLLGSAAITAGMLFLWSALRRRVLEETPA